LLEETVNSSISFLHQILVAVFFISIRNHHQGKRQSGIPSTVNNTPRLLNIDYLHSITMSIQPIFIHMCVSLSFYLCETFEST
jgi:hypothetical protein